MTIPLRLEAQAEPLPTAGALLQHDYLLPAEPRSEARSKLSTAELAFRIFAAFRAHPHINNVLTHISRANWVEVEHALHRILDLSTTTEGFSPLEENLIDLMVGERGTTGKILKPYFQAALRSILEPSRAERLICHINALYLELEWKVQHPPPSSASRSEPIQESDHGKANRSERVINVADIDARFRHTILSRLFEHLDPNQSLQIVVDHDPGRLRLQLEATHGSRCAWSYLEEGPDVWRVRLRLLPAGNDAHG